MDQKNSKHRERQSTKHFDAQFDVPGTSRSVQLQPRLQLRPRLRLRLRLRLQALTPRLQPTDARVAPAGANSTLNAEALDLPATLLDEFLLDRESFVRHRLSPDERRQFAEEGFLLIADAPGGDGIAALTAALDETHDRKLLEETDPSHPDASNRMALFTPANQLGNSEAVQRLLPCPAVFPKVLSPAAPLLF